jgi:hypothetical protein
MMTMMKIPMKKKTKVFTKQISFRMLILFLLGQGHHHHHAGGRGGHHHGGGKHGSSGGPGGVSIYLFSCTKLKYSFFE